VKAPPQGHDGEQKGERQPNSQSRHRRGPNSPLPLDQTVARGWDRPPYTIPTLGVPFTPRNDTTERDGIHSKSSLPIIQNKGYYRTR